MPVKPFGSGDAGPSEHPYKITVGTGSLIANAATIGAQSLTTSPSTILVILPPGSDEKEAEKNPTAFPGAIVGKSQFRMVFFTVVALTIVFFVAAATFAIVFEAPTPAQKEMLSHLNSAWQLCIGAIIGLLTGKVSK